MIDGRAANDRMNPVAGRDRVFQTFQYDQAASLAAPIAVGCCVKRLAAAVRRQHAGLAQSDHAVRPQHQADTAGQCDAAIAGLQAAARLMHRDQ